MRKHPRIRVDAAVLGTFFLLAGSALAAERGREQTEGTQAKPLELSAYELKLVYETDFSKPLKMLREGDLVKGKKRLKRPENVDWVLEGPGSAWTEDGSAHVSNSPRGDRNVKPAHMVLWNMQVFPADFLLEVAVSPRDSNEGLAIIFFCATAKDGGGIFDLNQPPRGGIFKNYIKGGIDCYHVSYWAGTRKFSNLRKNHGFHLVASGDDNIFGQGPGPHKLRLLKVGGKIQLEARGRTALSWTDNGAKYGKVHGKGRIGLRTMGHTGKMSYSNLKVWAVTPK